MHSSIHFTNRCFCVTSSPIKKQPHEHPEVSLLPLLVTPQRWLLFTLLSSEINFAQFWSFYKWNSGHVLFCLASFAQHNACGSDPCHACPSSSFPQLYCGIWSECATANLSIELLIRHGLFPLRRGVTKRAAALNFLLHVLWQTYALLSHGYVIRNAVVTAAIYNYVLDKICMFSYYVLANTELLNF